MAVKASVIASTCNVKYKKQHLMKIVGSTKDEQ